MFSVVDWNFIEITTCAYFYIIEPQLSNWGLSTLLGIFFLKTATFFLNLMPILYFKSTIINALVFSIKFLILIALLVFVRGGIPRYRYDFLTKVGWIKFLSLILSIFLSSILLVYLA